MSLNSELKLPTWLKILPFVFVTLMGVGLRLANLESTPYGLDVDQAKVLSWGATAIENGEIRVYAQEETQFEALSSYLFAAADKFMGREEFPGLGARMLSLIFSLFDLVLLGLLLRKLGPVRMWQGIALLATCPWAIFYARIAGPCVGVSGLLLLELYLATLRFNTWPLRLGIQTLGLLYYSLYRLIWIFEFATAAFQKNRRRMATLLVPVGIVALLILITQGFGTEAARGLYNLPLGWTAVSARIGAWFSLWFWSPADVLISPIPDFVVDPVSMGFSRLLSSGQALGLGLVPLWILALCCLRGFWKTADAFDKKLIMLFGFVVAALFISPTYSHGLLILPLVPYLVILILNPIMSRKESLSMIFGLAVFVSGIGGIAQSLGIINTLAQHGMVEEVFPDRLRHLFEVEVTNDPAGLPRSYFLNQNYHTGRYWSEILTKRGYAIDAYPPLDMKSSLDILSVRFRESSSQIIYFDIQDVKYPWVSQPSYLEAKQRLQQLEIHVLESFEVLEKKDVFVLGKPVARRYLIRRY